MIDEENKNKQPLIEQQGVTHRKDFAKPNVDEEAIMRVMSGEKPVEIETEHSKPSVNNSKKGTSKTKKLVKEDYCGQFFKIPTTTASRGKSVYVRQEHHETFNRLTNIMGLIS